MVNWKNGERKCEEKEWNWRGYKEMWKREREVVIVWKQKERIENWFELNWMEVNRRHDTHTNIKSNL
jgi:hypothetical protein